MCSSLDLLEADVSIEKNCNGGHGFSSCVSLTSLRLACNRWFISDSLTRKCIRSTFCVLNKSDPLGTRFVTVQSALFSSVYQNYLPSSVCCRREQD
jgi:hypothetical protein